MSIHGILLFVLAHLVVPLVTSDDSQTNKSLIAKGEMNHRHTLEQQMQSLGEQIEKDINKKLEELSEKVDKKLDAIGEKIKQYSNLIYYSNESGSKRNIALR